jgi:hypothetical protein
MEIFKVFCNVTRYEILHNNTLVYSATRQYKFWKQYVYFYDTGNCLFAIAEFKRFFYLRLAIV